MEKTRQSYKYRKETMCS